MSEYGKGFAYNLGLFLAHAERDIPSGHEYVWFSGACDHLIDIETSPAVLGEEIAGQVNDLVRLCYRQKDNIAKNQAAKMQYEITRAIKMAKHILYLWDIKTGIDAIKGEYE